MGTDVAGDGVIPMLHYHAEGGQPLPQDKGWTHSTGGRLSAETVQDNTVSCLEREEMEDCAVDTLGEGRVFWRSVEKVMTNLF